MLRLASSFRNAVHIEVGNSVEQQAQIAEARFFCRLAKCRIQRLLARFQMTAHLQPATESPVMMEQKPPAGIEHETARGHMTGNEVRARIRLGCGAQQLEKRLAMQRLPLIEWLVGGNHQLDGNHW